MTDTTTASTRMPMSDKEQTPPVMTSPALLRLMQLVSPALPIGAFAYSQGLEFAVEAGWVHDEESMSRWLQGVMQASLGALDVPVMGRLYNAWQGQNLEMLDYWNEYLLASRESRELLLEDRQIGAALIKLLLSLEVDGAEHFDRRSVSLPAAFTLAAVRWNIPKADTCLGYLWSWAENQVAAATKTIPLGQTAGQRILDQALPIMPNLVQQGVGLEDDDIGCNLPGLAMGSALHETQYSRLFRS